MKKSKTKLSLRSETLRQLANIALTQVAGGGALTTIEFENCPLLVDPTRLER